MYDVDRVREDFPILKTGIIYLDSTASSLTPEPVLNKMMEYYHEYRANVERGIYRLSQRASEEYENAHRKVASFINAKSDSEIVMTKNTTEGINLVANGLAWKRGDKIVTTLIEHHSNFIVWLRVKQRFGVEVEIVKPNAEGLFDLKDFERAIDDKTRLVAVTHASNVLGTILPVAKIAEIAHDHGSLILVDGAQSVPHMKTDVRDIGCDFLAFSGHKMCGPTGSGALYIKEECSPWVDPLAIGGGTIDDVGEDFYKLGQSPRKFEAGTPAVAEAIGLGAATDYLRKLGMDNIRAWEERLVEIAYKRLKQIRGVDLYGPPPGQRIGIVSFNVKDLNAHDVALVLDTTANICVRSGHHCALPLTKSLIKAPGTVRASTYLYNTEQEISKLISTVEEIARSLGTP